MDAGSLLELLDRLRSHPTERDVVEFKSNLRDVEKIGSYLSALANAAALAQAPCAWLVWGVHDKTHDVTGTTFDPYTTKAKGNQHLIMWLQNMTAPRADFEFFTLDHPDGPVVMLQIHAPRSAPVAFQHVRYIRVDSHTVKLGQHPDKEARLWSMLGVKNDWTGAIVAGASINDLDEDAVHFARQRFTEYLVRSELDASKHERIRTQAAQWDISTLLNKAHVTKQGRITRAALLLLGRDEAAHFLAPADIKMSWILRDDANKTVTSQHFGMPFLLNTDALFKHVRNVQLEHMPDGSLFPTPIAQYDPWVIREALHNCIAHQDYVLGGKINVTEHPDKLVFGNMGAFIPPSVEWMLEHQSPPEHYRNQWLIDAMVRLRMVDQIGSGIRRMFEVQRERFFPLPGYIIDTNMADKPRVEVTVNGKILDANYTRMLMRKSDLELRQVLLLDRVQKGIPIDKKDAKSLRQLKLIEGRAPRYYVSSKVAEWTAQKARYIHNRGIDDGFYKQLVTEYLEKYGQANRKDIDDLLLPKLPEVLTAEQKGHKVRNLLQAMRRDGRIENTGDRGHPAWQLTPD